MTPLLLTLTVAGHPPVPPPPVFPPPVVVPYPGFTPPPPVFAPPQLVVPTVKEFAATFQPTPGHHRVVILHPRTCKPVEVCFRLPPGCPRKVYADRTEIDFKYHRLEVQIHFRKNGTVDVEYDD
jgi:hypothetical protein